MVLPECPPTQVRFGCASSGWPSRGYVQRWEDSDLEAAGGGADEEEAEVQALSHPVGEARDEGGELAVGRQSQPVLRLGRSHALEKLAECAEKVVDAHGGAGAFALGF